jgi:membrane protease YdiL (CAAX protease family)
MKSVINFSVRKPLIFVLVVLVAWMILVTAVAVPVGILLNRPIADSLIQAVGALIATLILLLAAYRIGWINHIGITSFGSRLSWVVTLALSMYVILAGFYAYFGEFSFQVSSLLDQEAWPILLQGLRAGFVEEVVFRGVILYSLVRVWGKENQGVVTALIVQAVLFALPHVFQVLAGVSPTSALSNVLATLIFGLWTGMLVVAVGSLWPAIFLHAVSNSFTMIKGLSSVWITPYYLGYLRGALIEIPLVLIGLWIVLKGKGNQKESPEELSEPGASA